MKTNLLRFFGVLLSVFTISFTASAYDFEVDGLYYNLTSLPNRTCQLTSGEIKYSGELDIPESVNYEGLEIIVTSLDPSAFNSNITGLIIPASIQEIPKNSISSCKLTKLIFKDSELDIIIRDYSSGYSNMTNGQPISYLYLGRNLTPIGAVANGAFKNLNIEELLIGKYVSKIPGFQDCINLRIVTIPDNITEIKSFSGCSNLKDVYIGNGISTIPSSCFSKCSNLENVYLGNQISNISIYAFDGCKSLKNIYLCSDNLSTINSDCIPTTVSRIYVPNTARYENLLKDYYLDNLITLNPSTSEYSGKAPTFSYNNNVEGAEISFDSPEFNFNVGEYNTSIPVTFTIGAWSSTVKVNGSYTITPATLNVIAKDVTKKYGEENPALECSFFGFKNNENESVLTKKPTLETTATKSSNAGTYPIIPYGSEAQNYTFNYERGTLTVLRADQTITWNQTFDNITVGDVIELTAQSSAGLQIKYTTTDDAIADIYTQNGKRYVEFMKPGTVSIRANQEGNENYNEADRVSKSITVNSKTVPVTGISLNQTSLTLNVDESYKLVATITPTDATSQLVIWTSDNQTVATVGDDGRVYAETPGSAIITAECGGMKATCTVTVKSPELNGISLDKNAIEMDIKNEAIVLTVTHSPDNADKPQLYWTSSNDAVAKVESTGDMQAKVIPVSTGSANISVQVMTNAALRDVCEVKVTDKQSFIDEIFGDDADCRIDIYNIKGQIVKLRAEKADVKDLAPGLYVVNGKKVMIR